MLYTLTGYLVLVTCIATNCTAKQQPTSWTTKGSENPRILVNDTILQETNCNKLNFCVAKLCFSTKCNQKQCESMISKFTNITSDKCRMKIISRQTCNMANACKKAVYTLVLQLTTRANENETCDMAEMVFSCKDANQLNRPCQGVLLCPCKPPRSCPDIIRCACKAEPTKCTPPTTTTTPTASGTTTDGQDATQMGVLVGGVVGGLFGGVVITVVIVFLCRACRSKRRHTENEDEAETKTSRTYLGLIPTTSPSPDTHAVTANIPDVIKVSAVQQASSVPSDVYDVIKEGEDNQLRVDPSAGDQGDYVEITDDMTGAAVYSLGQAAPGVALQDSTPQPAATETGPIISSWRSQKTHTTNWKRNPQLRKNKKLTPNLERRHLKECLNLLMVQED